MSCLRSDEAFSISSSSAKANGSAGVFRFSSWRFIWFYVVRGAGIARLREPCCGRSPSGVRDVGEGWESEKNTGQRCVDSLPNADMQVKHDCKGLVQSRPDYPSKWFNNHKYNDRDHRQCWHLVDRPEEARRMRNPARSKDVAPCRQCKMEYGQQQYQTQLRPDPALMPADHPRYREQQQAEAVGHPPR